MKPIAPESCDFCSSHPPGGHLVIGRDVRGPDSWNAVHAVDNYCLCATCFHETTALIATAIGPNENRLAGCPITIAPNFTNYDECNLCGGQLGGESYHLDCFPTQVSQVRRGISLQVRICVGCMAWARSRLYEDSGVRGGGTRGSHENRPTLLPAGCDMIASAFLSRGDELRLRSIADRSGCDYLRLRPAEARDQDAWQQGTVFVGSGSSGLATMLAESLPVAARRRMVIVSRFECMEDTGGGLRLGATAFVASPLTDQHIIGACVQVGAALGSGPRRQHSSGLPFVGTPDSQGGEATSHILQFQVDESRYTLDVAWIVRRFLRGVDEVGVDGTGKLQARIVCPEAAINEVRRRMAFTLGAGVLVSRLRPDSPQTGRKTG